MFGTRFDKIIHHITSKYYLVQSIKSFIIYLTINQSNNYLYHINQINNIKLQYSSTTYYFIIFTNF